MLLDDTDVAGAGGTLYDTYGITDAGALAVVRPDGYIGVVAPLTGVDVLNAYFARFSVL